MSEEFPQRMFARTQELRQSGVESILAGGLAWLEERVHQWPPEWGDNLKILLYGDFQEPSAVASYPSLGITVFPEKKPNTIIRGATIVLEATVTVQEKSVAALIDAARRINVFLGVQTLYEWGNAGIGWWSWVTHGTSSGASVSIAHKDLEACIRALLALRPDVRARVEAALFWVREPRPLVLESYRPSILRMYSSYWNAFECLVEAVAMVRPRAGSNRSDKQSQIDEFVRERKGKLTAHDIQECYVRIVNPGFVAKAEHALRECFPKEWTEYAKECFRLSDEKNRLYDIRNGINHGDIDAEHPEELLRVEARFRRLWMIVWRMFACFVQFPSPVDSKLAG